MKYRQKVVWLKFEPKKNQEDNRAARPNPCAKRLVQLMIRGNTGRHIPPILYSAFCPSAGEYAECTSHNPPQRDIMRKQICAKMRIA